MSSISPRGYRNTARLLVLGATAAFATTAAPVHAQAPGNATVRSIEAAGMLYVGGNADNNVRITLSGTTFTIDDVIPITAGTGCKPVSGDATKATCVAFKVAPNGRFKVFNVNTGFGNDKIANVTSIASIPGNLGAPMRANGSSGDDMVTGDPRAEDTLIGSTGNDTLRDPGGQNEFDGAAATTRSKAAAR